MQNVWFAATSIGSAAVLTVIASAFFMPGQLLPVESPTQQAVSSGPIRQEAH